MIPVFVCNSRGEAIRCDFFDYCAGINECDYLKTLFNNKAIIFDTNTIECIDYNKYNSLPILYNKTYGIDVPGVVNIHSQSVLENYLAHYKLSNAAYIISTRDYIVENLNSFKRLIIIFCKRLDGLSGEPVFLDSNIWVYQRDPLVVDNYSIVYTAINKVKLLNEAAIQLKRLVRSHEKEIIINAAVSSEKEVPYIQGLPLNI